MKLPLSWLREFVALPKNITNDQITAAFVKVGFEVESVINPSNAITGPIKVGTVRSIEELSGNKKPIRYVGLDLAEGSLRYVICGATNFKVDDQVVVALPGAVLPGDFAISARQTYGKLSDGMICSARELGLGEDHSGIIVLSERARNGAPALALLGADDPIFDIAVNPDRGYAMSIRGAARELAMALGVPFRDIDRAKLLSSLARKKKAGKVLPVSILDKSGADSIFLRSLENLNQEATTPTWMSRRLVAAGMRPISLAVDITNYVMLELGQPLHAFDASKIEGGVRVQRAGKFKSIKTLDGQVRSLDSDDLVIADSKRPLALAGTMGGADSEVTEETTSVALEAAHFNPIAIARNSRRHILSSEASRRFERGVDPSLAEIASARAALLLMEFGSARYVGTSSVQSRAKPRAVTITPDGIPALIGTAYSPAEITKALTAIGCKILKSGKRWKVTPPSWRSDLLHISDFSEEVARYFGYERIPARLPEVKSMTASNSGLTPLQLRRRYLSMTLANRGYTEVHSYPFVSPEQMELFAFTGDRAKAFEILNPISAQYPLLRTHLSPGLLDAARRNLARGEKSVALFESGLIFRDIKKISPHHPLPTDTRPSAKAIKVLYENVPFQSLHIGGVIAGEAVNSGWWGRGRVCDWQDSISAVRALLDQIGQQYEVKNVELAPWHPGRCAEFTINGRAIAHAGEIHPRVTTALSLPERTAFFALVLDAIPISDPVRASAVAVMPAAIQDISLFVPASVSAAEVERALRSGAGELLEEIYLFDRFQKAGEDRVSLAFTLTFRAADRTLTTEEVSALRSAAGAAAELQCGAKLRTGTA